MFFAPLLRRFTHILTQTDADAKRFAEVSASARVAVTGNMKFDQKLPELPDGNVFDRYFGSAPERLIVLGASTHPGEEALLVDCFRGLRKQFPGLKLVLVPRHAERGGDIAAMLRERGETFARRSRPDNPPDADVLLADTTGEMPLLMHGADVVVMGKSFAGHDEGHNLVEPALLGKPIVTGPVLRNFRYIFSALESKGALIAATDAELPDVLQRLLASSELRNLLGQRAFEVVDVNRGAVDRTIDILEKSLAEAAEAAPKV